MVSVRQAKTPDGVGGLSLVRMSANDLAGQLAWVNSMLYPTQPLHVYMKTKDWAIGLDPATGYQLPIYPFPSDAGVANNDLPGGFLPIMCEHLPAWLFAGFNPPTLVPPFVPSMHVSVGLYDPATAPPNAGPLVVVAADVPSGDFLVGLNEAKDAAASEFNLLYNGGTYVVPPSRVGSQYNVLIACFPPLAAIEVWPPAP